jgi:hypothetical protein
VDVSVRSGDREGVTRTGGVGGCILNRHSKSYVVNDGSLSTEVLGVAIWVLKYKQ